MNQFEALASEEPGFNESELFYFQSLVTDAKIALQDDYTQFELSKYPANVSLLAVSSKFGYYVAGTTQGFVYGSTETLRNTTRDLEKGGIGKLPEKIEITIPSPVQHLRLNADETQLVVNAGVGEIFVYNAKDIMEQGASAQPAKTFQLAGRVIDILPNPDTLPTCAAVLLEGGRFQIIDLTTGDAVASNDGDDFTAICWSRKGKQVVCGKKNGSLETYNTSGTLKASIDAPDAMKAGSGDETQDRYVLAVHWIDTHVFFVVYARPRESSEDEHIHDAYIIDRSSESTNGIKYIKLEEVTPVFGMDEREAHMYIEVIRDYSMDMKNAIIVAHSAATDISVVGQDENGDWQVWALPENGLAGLPLSEETNMDTFPVGLALDFSTKEDLPPFDEATSSERVKPVPVLLYLNDEDRIGAYYCYNSGIASRGEKYAGMIEARDVREAESTTTAPAVPASTPAAAPIPSQQQQQSTSGAFGIPESKPAAATGQPSNFASSPFGTALAQPGNGDSFASLLSGESTAPPTQPMGGFNSGAAGGGFGSFKNLSLSTNAKTPSNNLSVFNGDNKSSFGTPSFGTPSFGTSSFGTASFGGTPTSAPTTSGSFASLAKAAQTNKASNTGFGGFASTPSSNTPTFGMSSFGATSDAPKNNQSFASLASPGQQQQQQSPSQPLSMSPGAFGTAKAPSGFGSTGFGSTGFGVTPVSTPAISFQSTTPTSSAPAFGAKTGPKEGEGKTNTTEKAEENTPNEKSVSEPSASETTIKAKSVEGDVPKEEKETTKLAPSTEQASSSTGPGAFGNASTASTDSTAKPASFGDLPKLQDAVKPPTTTNEPAPSTTTPTQVPGFGSFMQPPSSGGKVSFADIGKSAQSLPKAPGFGSGTSLFGGATSGSKPLFGSSSFGSTTTTSGAPTFGTTSFGSTTTASGVPTFGATSFGSSTQAPASTTDSPLTKQTTSALNSGSAFKDITSKPSEKPVATSIFGQPAASKLTPTAPSTSKPAAASTPSFGFGSKSAIPTTAPPAAASPLKAPSTTSNTVPNPETPTVSTPKPKTPAEENMATEFESLYFLMNDSFKKLELKQDGLKKKVDEYRKQGPIGKSIHDLDNESSWRVGDVQDLGVVADQVTERAQGLRPRIIQIQQSLRYFDEDTMKLRAKDVTIAELLKNEPDAKIRKDLDNRQLNREVVIQWEQIKSRSKCYGEQLDDLESKLQDYKKKLRAPVFAKSSSNGVPSLYGLYVQLREIDKELKIKEATVKDLEEQFAYAGFKAIHDQARHSSLGFGLYDGDEEEEEEEKENEEGSDNSEEKEEIRTEGPWPSPIVEATARHLRREQFLDRVWQFQSQKSS